MSFVKLEKQGHVGIVTIDRQEALNALNSQVLDDLDRALKSTAVDAKILLEEAIVKLSVIAVSGQ